ncbi:MAG: hypothetical protein R2761_24540 [Acidimicrobiales bacterium]
MTLFDTGDYWRHPALWPPVMEDDVSLDEQARWVWPASFPIDGDTWDADTGRETWDMNDWSVRDAYRNWVQDGRPDEGLAEYRADVWGER